jgi:hypothetical protein
VKKRRTPAGPSFESYEHRLPPGASLGSLVGMVLTCACIAAIDEGNVEAAVESTDDPPGTTLSAEASLRPPPAAQGPEGPPVSTVPMLLAMNLDDSGSPFAPTGIVGADGPAEGQARSAQAPEAPAAPAPPASSPGDTGLWDAALSDGGDDSSADDTGGLPVPQPNSAPTPSGGAMPSGGGGGGSAPAPVVAATTPVVASAADMAASSANAAAAPAATAPSVFLLNSNDPNSFVMSSGAATLMAASSKGGKGLSAASLSSSSLLQQSAGTKTNYISGIPDPGVAGPYATSVIDYNYGDTYFTFPAIPFNGTTSPGTALTTTRGGSTLQGAEFQGEITYPTDLSGGPHPLIILLHGRHSSVYNPATNSTVSGWPPTGNNLRIPSFQGYEYMAPILASHGFIVDSIGADAINAFDANTTDNGMLARAQLVMDQLNLWNQLDNTTTEPTAQPGFAQPGLAGMFTGKVNLQDVGLMGHSRGGEGVVEAYDLNQQMGSPYGIKAVFALAPVDFQRLTTPNVPFAVMLPYADGDVSDLQGMHFFDDMSLPSANDTSPKYEFLVMGADHDLFNTVWTQGLFPAGAADDWASSAASPSATRGADPYAGVVPNPDPTQAAPFPGALSTVKFPYISAPERLLPQSQQAADTAYESAFFQMYLMGQTQYQPILDGDAAPPASLQPPGMQAAIVYASYTPPSNSAVRLDVNDTLSPSNLAVNALGGNVSQGGLLNYTMAGNGNVPGETALVLPNEAGAKQPDSVSSSLAPTKGGLSQLVLDWNGTSAYWENDIPAAYQNVSGYGTLQFRAAINPSDVLNNALSENFSVELTDAEGHAVEVPVSNYTNWLFYPPGKVSPLPKLILQGIRIPLSAFLGIDLTQVTSIRFNFDQTSTGGLVFTALAFADASPTGKITSTTTS